MDSAVAAALAVEAGHEVTGVHMALLRNRALFREGSRGCCSIEDALDARRVADKLGIPFYVWDLSAEFADLVVADFLAEYAAGRTPNPCIRCNEHVKFNVLAQRAEALGFDAIATGHYARLNARQEHSAGNTAHSAANPIDITQTVISAFSPSAIELHRARNLAKDQSYVLAVAGPDRLQHAYFPLGDFETKQEVRAAASARNLPVSSKPDSYDICFIADGDTRGFLRDRLGIQPGIIQDLDGTQVGVHDGAYQFTVGQRKGLALGNPAPDGEPRYVVRTDPLNNIVTVGKKADLIVSSIKGVDPVWYFDIGSLQSSAIPVTIQVRAHGREVPAWLETQHDGTVRFDLRNDVLKGIAAGQSVVAYQGTRVVAQATVAYAK